MIFCVCLFSSSPKDVIELRENLNGMQFFLKQQHGQIMVLKDDMHSLQLRISESDVSFKTTRKMQQVSCSLWS